MNVDGKGNNRFIPCHLHIIVVCLNWMKAQDNYLERSALLRELTVLISVLPMNCLRKHR